ncbi:MAG: AAA family ATPase [Actinobacteria bacterium]|nr:AAA family ATPase [Actinomycetota bacterium]
MGKLVISVLGSPAVEVDGSPMQVDTRKATALLIYVAVTGRTQSRDRLAGLLWPEYDSERARSALRRTLSTLKKALGDGWISADRLRVSLDPGGVELDLTEFRSLLAEVDAHGHKESESCPDCARRLTRAVGLMGEGFLQGFSLRDAGPFDEWQSLESESIAREFAGALDRLVKAEVAQGDLESAVGVAERKLALDPLDEPAHRRLMQLYAWRGMRTAALQQYRECVAVLDRELGVSPLAETTNLYRAIGEGSVETREHSQLIEPPMDEPLPEPRASDPPSGDLSLRGRSGEWQRLMQTYSKVRTGGRSVTIKGEAGIGKTRLAREFVETMEERGAQIVSARTYEGEGGLPYALITQLLERLEERIRTTEVDAVSLAEAARLVPTLLPSSSPAGSVGDPGALNRFFEGLRRVIAAALAGPKPGIIFLDDLQWCDGASLEVIAYIARRLPETPLLIIMSWRIEEVDPENPLRKIEGDAIAQGGDSLSLARLQEQEVRALVTDAGTVPGSEIDTVAARLMQETEGIPFFIVEYLAVLTTAVDAELQMPSTIKELLRSRANLVGQTARQVLGAAAVIDRSFDFETVWRASGRTELEAVDALDELVRHGSIRLTAGASYEFSHEKLRTFIYGSMSPARRRVLHRRVAEAFIAVTKQQDQAPQMPALIARHLELGGMEEQAAIYHESAAVRARAVFANREALEHYLAALALGHPDPASLHEGAGDMLVLIGDYKRAVESFEKAAAIAPPDSVPVIEHKLGEVHLRRGDYDLSQSHFVVALETMDGADRVTEARLLAAMSFNAYRRGELQEATGLAQRSLEAARVANDERALARALNQYGILENAKGNHAAAATHLRESLALAEGLEDGPGRSAALNNLALAARSKGNMDTALQLTEQALAICAEQGDRHREAALRNNLADLLHKQGNNDAAMRQLKEAAAALAEIGGEPTNWLPEVWKLVEW